MILRNSRFCTRLIDDGEVGVSNKGNALEDADGANDQGKVGPERLNGLGLVWI